MEVRLYFTESAQENGNHYYEEAKRLKMKASRALKASEDLSKKLEAEKNKPIESNIEIIKVEDKKWYEKFHWFFTSKGHLVVGGRDAQQNEMLNSRYFTDSDLFFHANIFGASVTIMKDGLNSDPDERLEAAQMAASYSSAWKKMQEIVDVYAMKRDQVSKSTDKGSLSTGSFLLKGEREWFRNVDLSLAALLIDGKFNVLPYKMYEKLNVDKACILKEGKIQKSDAAKKISKHLSYNNIDNIMQQLPSGTFDIKLIGYVRKVRFELTNP